MSVQQMDVRANVPSVLLKAISRTAERGKAKGPGLGRAKTRKGGDKLCLLFNNLTGHLHSTLKCIINIQLEFCS